MAEKVRDTDDYPTEPFRDFQPKPELNKRPFIARLNALLDVILKSIAVFFTLIILIIFIFFEVKRNSVIIESFDVPKELQDQGYTSRVFVNKLLDQFAIIKETARTVLTHDVTRPLSIREAEKPTFIRDISTTTFIKETPKTTWKSPDFLTPDKLGEVEVKVPGTGFSLKFLLPYIKGILGCPSMHIVCEVTIDVDKDRPKLTTRVIGKPSKKDDVVLTNLDPTLLEAAKHIYKYTDPFTLASYYFNNKNYDGSLEIIQYCLDNDPPEDDHFAYILWGMILNDWGLPLEGFCQAKKIFHSKKSQIFCLIK